MYSQTSRYLKNPEASFRTMPEWHSCFVYRPGSRQIVELNTTAWLIVELCDGRPLSEISESFAEFVGSHVDQTEANQLFDQGITALLRDGIVIEIDEPSKKNSMATP